MIVGVFVFQGISRADDPDTTGGAGDVNLNIGVPTNEGSESSNEGGEPEDCEPVVCEEGDDTCTPEECEEDCEPVVCEEGDDTCTPKECEETGETGGETGNTGGTDDEEEPKVLKTFTLRYNANGGTGAPSTQECESYEKTCGFVVADSVPVRDGYEFRGWAKDGDTNDIYTARTTVVSDVPDGPLTLYAVWAEVKTYTLMYDINGGSGAPEVQACKSATGKCSFIVSGVTPSRAGFEFLNWLRGDETYMAGNEIIVTEAITILIAEDFASSAAR